MAFLLDCAWFHEVDRQLEDVVVDVFHVVLDARGRMRRQRTFVDNFLFADFSPARLNGRIIDVGRPGMNQIARPDLVDHVLRVSWPKRIGHRVQVIEVSEELIKAVDCREKLIQVAQVVLAELARGVTHILQHGGDRRSARRASPVASRLGRPLSCRCDRAACR